MNILTILTKKSVREIEKKRKFLKYYSLKDFKPGDMIEIIDGNRKSKAIILKSQNTSDLKEEIRSGSIEMKKMKFSKSGSFSNGVIIEKFTIQYIKQLLKNPEEIFKTDNVNLRNFFPKKRIKKNRSNYYSSDKRSGVSEIKDILYKKITGQEKRYNNPMQEIVDTIRTYFGENAVYGQGSFSYYIGFFKNMPLAQVYRIFAEVKQSKKSLFDQKKLFWYKIGRYIRKKNGNYDENEEKKLTLYDKDGS